jgi:Domain of unknown function (DUF4234)
MRKGTVRDPIVVLVLTLITCGLYYLWWVYETSREIDAYLDETSIPPIVHVVLFIATGTLWGYVFDVLTAQRIVRMQERAGMTPKDNSVLYVILDLLGAGPIGGLGLVSTLIQQSDLNAIYRNS